MKNKHPKRKIALKMLSKEEKEKHVSPFNSAAWNKRVEVKKIKRLLKDKIIKKEKVPFISKRSLKKHGNRTKRTSGD